jgi:hypothetical protein
LLSKWQLILCFIISHDASDRVNGYKFQEKYDRCFTFHSMFDVPFCLMSMLSALKKPIKLHLWFSKTILPFPKLLWPTLLYPGMGDIWYESYLTISVTIKLTNQIKLFISRSLGGGTLHCSLLNWLGFSFPTIVIYLHLFPEAKHLAVTFSVYCVL